MAKFVVNDDITQQIISSENIVYRNFSRIETEILSITNTYSFIQVSSPYKEFLIKRVQAFKKNQTDLIAQANLIILESQQDDPELPGAKILHYNNIDFSQDYLDSIEDIYAQTNQDNIFYIYVKGDTNTSDLTIKIDIEKVN